MPKKAINECQPSFELRLENFRLFRDSGWIRIAPLTCLVGRNSSGKTSIIAALLLLKQSVEQQAIGWVASPLILSGPYCDLGSYADLVHNHKLSSQVSFSFRLSLHDLSRFMSQRRSGIVDAAVFQTLNQPRPPYYFLARRPDDVRLPQHGTAEVRLSFAAHPDFGPSLARLDIDIPKIGRGYFLRTTDGKRRPHWRAYMDGQLSRALALYVQPRSFFPIIVERGRDTGHAHPAAGRQTNMFANTANEVFRFLYQSLTRSEMIGPFRTPPERRYSFGGFGAARGGPNGERSVDLLITELLLGREDTRPLQKAVSLWVRHLKLATTIDVRDLAKKLNLFAVNVDRAGSSTNANLADVGFGLSQVLPVVLQGLLVRRGGVFFVQQPEIHLHPDAQAGLADFFVFLATQGVTCIVETHSEYFLLRLRRRLAEGSIPETLGLGDPQLGLSPFSKNDLAVLVTGKQKKEACVTQLEVGNSFQFENLPKGFMSQALDDRLALLRAVGKRHE